LVIKKDKSRVPYDREKLINSVQKVCYKRPISTEQIQHTADRTEEYLFCHFDKEVPSRIIGEHIMKCLRAIDQIAYIRYASISRHYHNAHEFIDDVLQTIEQAEPMEQLKFFES
jgi:transcriptional repressor NrdR